MNLPAQRPESILFITLDSCRYDTFADADAPSLKRIGPLHRAMAPATFTFGSHAAMFVGFTPGIAEKQQSLLNPKFGKFFKLVGAGLPGKGTEFMTLQGRNIIDGLRRKGYRAIGSGAVGWFDDRTETSRLLTADFESFFYPGNTWSLRRQIEWIAAQLAVDGRPLFLFLNVGETHVPYYHEDAPWDCLPNPCIPFSSSNDAGECRRRQRLCLEHVDRQLAPLLEAFAASTTIICGDHGDCWGEDGLWEHGFYHPKVLEVPLIFRLAKQ